MVLSIMIPRNNNGVNLSVEASERLAVMRSLETNQHYSIPDYLSAGWQSRLWMATVLGGGSATTGVMYNAYHDVGISMDFPAPHVVPPADYGDDISLSSSSFNDQIIHEGWRDQVCQWTYAVADHFGKLIFP